MGTDSKREDEGRMGLTRKGGDDCWIGKLGVMTGGCLRCGAIHFAEGEGSRGLGPLWWCRRQQFRGVRLLYLTSCRGTGSGVEW